MFESLFQAVFSDEVYLQHQALAGGDINQVFLVNTKNGLFVIKVNQESRFPQMFEKECIGLQTLQKHSPFIIPEVYKVGTYKSYAFLIMEFIEKKSQLNQALAGQNLANQHQYSDKQFGFKSDNYIGSLVQKNQQTNDWNTFFIEQRLQVQIELASGILNKSDFNQFESIFIKLDQFFETSNPVLLHGDLWSGNIFSNKMDEVVLIDPAVYYGHPIMDLAMSRLFGGFSSDFYSNYQEIRPLASNWIEACDIANLYPLLVHVNLFGTAYLSQLRSILSTYS